MIVLIMAAVALTTFLVMQRSQRLIIEHEAAKIAEVIARQALASRSVYTAAVADKLAREGAGPDIDYLEKRGYVPLPSQFLKLVGHEASAHSAGLYQYRPLSKWNLEPSQGLRDDFQRWAWNALERQDQPNPSEPIEWRPVWRIEEMDGVRTLRYLRADSAASRSCVGCHNLYEARPETVALRVAAGVPSGKQWKQHQLLGAIEVDIPVDRIEALAAGQAWQTLALVVAISLIGLAVAAWYAFHDIRRKQLLAARYEHQARFDALTGLANRSQFQEQARAAVARAARDNRPVGMLFVDLDHFKRINDSLGHELGDRVIKEVARRLLGSLREIDLIARHSGDEFTILLNAHEGPRDFARTAHRVIDVVSQPLTLDGKELFLSASIGISSYPRDGYDVETLLKNADIAMYRAKEQGRNNYQFFSQEMDSRALETLSLSSHLRHAVARRQLLLYYQPRIDAASGTITAVEATLRWQHPELGLLEPVRFIRIAEDTGVIESIGEWVLTEACAQVRRWDRMGLPPLRISVNLSARQFRAVDFVEKVAGILRAAGVPPKRLELEITESVLMQQPDAAEIVLAQLHARGMTLAIDDFGTGYSSLSYLKRFPIDYLKIDKSFIDGLPADNNDRVICDAIIALGRNLGVKVVAEGVETLEQRRFLTERSCDELQGFLFARPAAAEAIEPLLRRGRFPVELNTPNRAERE
ncbi:MAG: putative bifunctional diguanylate cyclase/phosphodiesterase [Sulfurifustis sp.]